MQIFRPGANSFARIILVAIAAAPFLMVGLAYALVQSPYLTQQNIVRQQPVPFSHQHHVGGLGLDCRYCHASVETSRFAGLPPTETCMTCHSQVWTNAELLAPVRESLAQNRPIAWQRVHNLPDYVYFDHSVHVKNGVGCSTCHGQIETMPLTRQVVPLTMGWCLDCHRHPEEALRPRDAIFDQAWTPPRDQTVEGRRLLVAYRIHPEHLTDCSRCHR